MKRGWYRITSQYFTRDYYGRKNALGWFDYYRRHGLLLSMENWQGDTVALTTRREAEFWKRYQEAR